jgi:hypothetical protein
MSHSMVCENTQHVLRQCSDCLYIVSSIIIIIVERLLPLDKCRNRHEYKRHVATRQVSDMCSLNVLSLSRYTAHNLPAPPSRIYPFPRLALPSATKPRGCPDSIAPSIPRSRLNLRSQKTPPYKARLTLPLLNHAIAAKPRSTAMVQVRSHI